MNLPRLYGTLSQPIDNAQAQQEHGDGAGASYAYLAFALFCPFRIGKYG
ncbi:hypothetical protein CB010_011860 [Salmonella bongori]|uniref:Uncharacterized protein n=1 Tax=Salmonella bongori N268-08 TaxID=1197719 RepID=S5MVE6_SALBN|nr:hypothetical protein A464_3417 [Salmonella bongori N268-08]EEO9371893.1 hypothetical protein [Salmonella bongori]MBA3151346.1 hypothetical protein [Salmonella bongori]